MAVGHLLHLRGTGGATPTRARRKPWLSLRLRVILITIALQVIFIAAFGGILVYNEYRSMGEFVRDSSVTFATCVAHSSAAVLSRGDHAMLADSLAMASEQHGADVGYLVVQDNQGRVLASTSKDVEGLALSDPVSLRARGSGGPIIQELRGEAASAQGLYRRCVFDIAVPILDDGARVGMLRLGVSSRGIDQRVRNVVVRGLWMAGVALVAGGLLAVAVDRKMQRSLRDLIRVTRGIAAGDLGQRVSIDTGDEIEELGDTFNQMTEQLAASHDELRRWGENLEAKVRVRTQELEEERRKLDGIVSSMGAGLLLLDHDLRIQWANKVARGWFGPLERLVGTPCSDSLWRGASRCRDCASARALHSGELEQSDMVAETPAGQRRFFHMTASPIRDHRGEVVQVVELMQDVTERQQMEQQLMQAGKMAAIGELAAAVAHEINNPLAVIGASVERMQALLGAEEGRQQKFPTYLEAIHRHVYRCKETIDKLLGFARHKELEIRSADLNCVLRDAVGLAASRAALSGARVTTDLSLDLPALDTDPHGLVQVFVNLLTNALDACDDRGEICISSRRKDDRVVVEVTDNGCGIAEEHLDSIFDPFFTTKPEGKGTGLGLSICRRIVTRLGGDLTVRSRAGAGSTFTVSLPLRKNAEAVTA